MTTQSLTEPSADLLRPDSENVVFWQSCERLARIYLYEGASYRPVSLAFHTLIAIECAEESIKPWVAVHNLSLSRLIYIPEEVRRAFHHFAARSSTVEQIQQVFREFDRLGFLHWNAIRQAAGLPLPTDWQEGRVRTAELRAFATEVRDFRAPASRRELYDPEQVVASTRVYQHDSFGNDPFGVAQELHRRLQTYLPALAPRDERLGAKV